MSNHQTPLPDLAQCTGLISRAVANLGSTEEDLPLSRILSNLSENFGKIEKVHFDQADLDFFSFSELFKDHLQMLSSIAVRSLWIHSAWFPIVCYLQERWCSSFDQN